jgi:hypothetical protein
MIKYSLIVMTDTNQLPGFSGLFLFLEDEAVSGFLPQEGELLSLSLTPEDCGDRALR